ncbi:hypothetical protein J2S70_000413 [Trueperella bonasi]|uniref:Uncharacterized protein n=1 Tax=Trueperella bonasi TaxID=312286 RepID=A0ABT9NEM8_9ACTO|nr:hypothetical protein [Trueperella bonasi]
MQDLAQYELRNSYHVATIDFDKEYIFETSANLIEKWLQR